MNHDTFHTLVAARISKPSDISSVIVKSIIELIDPVRTKRKDVADLEKVEKTFIGTKVEMILRYQLEVERGLTLDCVIDGVEFDIKCTIGQTWMIPPEAIDNFCVVVKINWNKKRISLGTFLASKNYLTSGTNQDKKRSISADGKKTIKWFFVDQPFLIPTSVPFVEWKRIY